MKQQAIKRHRELPELFNIGSKLMLSGSRPDRFISSTQWTGGGWDSTPSLDVSGGRQRKIWYPALHRNQLSRNVGKHQPMLRNFPEERRSHLHRVGNLKSRVTYIAVITGCQTTCMLAVYSRA